MSVLIGADGTATPRFIEGPVETREDVRLTRRFFLIETSAGLISGTTFNIRATVAASTRAVWPAFKDLNLWQRSHHRYSGVVGDLEGKSFRIANSTQPDRWLSTYDVIRVIPEHLMVFSQPVVEDEDLDPEMKKYYGGGVSPGFHVFMISPRDGQTDLWIQMEHRRRGSSATDEEALAPWLGLHPESRDKWRDSFIPSLKRLSEQAERR